MKYIDTNLFVNLLAPMDAAIVELEFQYRQLARTIEEKKLANAELSKSKQKSTVKNETSLRKIEKDIEIAKQKRLDLYRLKLKPIELVTMLMECDGTLWTPEEALEWGKELANQEGRGEKGLRIRHNLPQVSTTQDVDLPEINEEVKCIESASGGSLQTIRPGTHGNKIYSAWMFLSAELGAFKNLSTEHRDAIMFGELLRSMLYGSLPAKFKNEIHELLKPSNVLGHYNAVNAVTKCGFIRVPREDFNSAWSLVSITKGGPKYELKTSYIVERLVRTVLDQDTKNAA